MTSAAHVQMRMRKSNMLHCKYHGFSVTVISTLRYHQEINNIGSSTQSELFLKAIPIQRSELSSLEPGKQRPIFFALAFSGTPGITGPGSPQRPGFCGAWRIDWKASERTWRTWTTGWDHSRWEFFVLGHVWLNFRGHVDVHIPAPWSNMFWWFGSFVYFSIYWE